MTRKQGRYGQNIYRCLSKTVVKNAYLHFRSILMTFRIFFIFYLPSSNFITSTALLARLIEYHERRGTPYKEKLL